ncbi:MAG: hypothetical protein GX211_08890 [Clostridiaceae bacterium]|nr:hypothetical protein [Clostridiaceae bacterium]
MIMIFTALNCEAKPIIRYFGLKKDPQFHMFQVFKNEDIILLVTKPGIVNAAIGVAHLCSVCPPNSSDLLLNIGICGAKNRNMPIGTVYLCNKIYEMETGFCYYPDMIYAHPFKESGILSSTSPVLENSAADLPENLADMEAVGIYRAGILFFQLHQMFIVKIVSDHLQFDKIDSNVVSDLIGRNMPEIAAWITRLHSGMINTPPVFTPEEENLLAEVSKYLRLTVSMQNQLRQAIHYYKLQHGSFSAQLSSFIQKEIVLPVKNKYERKKCFERLMQEFA